MRVCAVNDCDKPARKREWCYNHYRNWRLYGDPLNFIGPDRSRTVDQRFEDLFCPEPNTGCWLWVGAVNSTGYGHFKLNGKPQLAHRVSWQIYNGEIPGGGGYHGTCVLHMCDTPVCVNPDHLFLGTAKDNNLDKVSKGRHGAPYGEEHPNARLTENQVLEIFNSDALQKDDAAKYGLNRGTVSKIKLRKIWKHLHDH